MLKANNDEDNNDDDDDENDDRETDEATMMKCLRSVYNDECSTTYLADKPAKRLLTNDGGINNFRLFTPCCKLDFHKNDNNTGVVLNVLNPRNKNKLMMMTTRMTTIVMMMMMIVTMMKPMMIKCLRSPFTGKCTTGSSANKTGLNYELLCIHILCYFSCNYFCLFAWLDWTYETREKEKR